MNRLTVLILLITIMLFSCEIRFSGSEPGVPSETLASLITSDISGITESTANGGGNITSDGGSSVTTRGVVWSVNPAPTTSLTTKTVDGSGTGSFPSSIKGLASNTKYYVRAYAVNSSGTAYGNEVSFTTAGTSGSSGTTQGVPCPGASTVKDIDGNTYNTVQIGSQCWMKENLRVTKYSDGTSIPLDNSGGNSGTGLGQAWGSRTTGARTIYANSQTNLATFGYLYNWNAAKGIATAGSTSFKNICPTGWRVPSEEEWKILKNYLGGDNIAGGKMKSTTGWNAPNSGATNESGFTGLPGGFRNYNGLFYFQGSGGIWWSSSELNALFAWNLSLEDKNSFVNRDYIYDSKSNGLSVRCLKDNGITPSTSIPTVTTSAISGITTSTANGGGNITSDGGSSVTSRGVVWSVNPAPTTSLTTKTVDGSGTGSFPSSIKGLASNTKYYVRAYAVNSSGTAYGNEVTFTTSGTSGSSGTTQGVPCPGASTVKDIDGNTYNTVQIGTQCWTKENLRVTKYSDGTSIPLDNSGGTSGDGSDQTWSSSSRKIGARTIYAHSQTNLVTYGYLYNWYAAKGIATAGSTSYKNLCPTGWHVPSDAEWTNLSTFLGGVDVAGGKMKTTGTTLWVSQKDGATNESGFSGIPGGWRGSLGSFNEISKNIYMWSTSENTVNPSGWLRGLSTGNFFYRNWYVKNCGAYIRCLRD